MLISIHSTTIMFMENVSWGRVHLRLHNTIVGRSLFVNLQCQHFLLNGGGEFSPSGLNEGFCLRISDMKKSGVVASDADDCSHEDSR